MTERTASTIIQQFKEWAHWTTRALVLDTETTDLDGEVIELAIVQAWDGTVLFNERFRPRYPVSAGALAVHGITDADLAGCGTFGEAWPRLRRRLASKGPLLIYNKVFDLGAMGRSLDGTLPDWYKNPDPATSDVRTGDPYSADHWLFHLISWRAQCVMEAYAPLAGMWSEWHGSYTWARLTAACEARGVDVSDLRPHSAVGDALATVRLIQACAQLDPADFPWIGKEHGDED